MPHHRMCVSTFLSFPSPDTDLLSVTVSIENAVTTKRRAEKVDRAREKSKRAKVRLPVLSSRYSSPY